MFISTKEECQLTPIKKAEYNRRLNLSERSNSGDIVLVSSTEIKYIFLMLLDPLKCYNSIQRLNKIAQRHHFTVIKEYYDNIFFMIRNANSISETLRQKFPNQPVISASEIINQCLALVLKIASFPLNYFLIIDEIELEHIKYLYDLLPNEIAFKILGKLLVENIDFAKHIINLGIESIEEKITELNTPLFIYFLGSFAYFPDLNEIMLPFYEEYIINTSTSQNETIRRYSYDALSILIPNSPEMCSWIQNLPIMTSIFKITPVSQLCAKKYIELAYILLKNKITTFLSAGNGFEELIDVLHTCFKDETGLAVLASKVLILLVQLGFLSFLIDYRIDDTLFSFSSGYYIFKEKESAMKTLCILFLNSDRSTKIRYLSRGFADIVLIAIEMGGSELHEIGIHALLELIAISNDEPDFDSLKVSISQILEKLSLEEYDQIVPPIL